jgi:hypothetical protein
MRTGNLNAFQNLLELVRLKVDVIVAGGTLAVAAAKQVTSTILLLRSALEILSGLDSLPASLDQERTSQDRLTLTRTSVENG